jgi:hypothetical protein
VDERGFADLLRQIIDEFADEHPSQMDGYSEKQCQIARTDAFDEGVPATRALVVTMRDGSAFRISIARSR